MRRLNQIPHLRWWLWRGGVGLVFVSVAMLVLMNPNEPREDESSSFVGEHEPSAIVPSLSPTGSESLVQTVLEGVPLPALDYSLSSVEDACGFSELPTYWIDGTFQRNTDHPQTKFLESEECRIALETYMNTVNPQHFLLNDPISVSLAEFVALENPLTFERLFENPADDLARMQDALSRPECLLEPAETNWDLKETCHADAFFNFALVNLFCFNGGIENRIPSVGSWELSFTPELALEQDRTLWKQDLEDEWVLGQCEELDPWLELAPDRYPELHALVMPEREPNSRKGFLELVLELSARFGSDLAGLTQQVASPYTYRNDWQFNSVAYEFGRFSHLKESGVWRRFSVKHPPKTDRFLDTFQMLAILGARKPDPHDVIEFDWELVARHLCERPFPTIYKLIQYSPLMLPPAEENVEHLSCKEVVHELRQQNTHFQPLLDVLDRFEQVALKLDIYD